ncbi:MAG: aminoglycoside phosphotransferase family protein [bacterium]
MAIKTLQKKHNVVGLDENIIDAKLPQLPWVLNESFMLDFFRDRFRIEINNGSGELNGCEIIGKRYKPGKRCTVTYALNFERLPKVQILYTRIESPGNVGKKKARLKAKGAELLPALGMYVWRFPHDPKLESLRELTDPDAIQQILASLGKDNSRADSQLFIQLLNYVPRRHCALLVKVHHPSLNTSTKIFTKVYGNNRGAQVYSAMGQLWRQQSQQKRAFCVVKPLAYDCERKVLWQSWLEGKTFLQFAKVRGLEYAVVSAATGLADLHQSKLEGIPRYTREDSFKKLFERAKLLMSYNVQFKKSIAAIWSCVDELKSLSPSVHVTIHGDFNYSQILFDFEKPVFVDFDSVSLGDPLYDVAHFITGLHRLAAQKYFSPHDVERVIGQFIEMYEKCVPWQVSKQALNAQIATALVCRRAYKVLRQLERNTIQKIEYYLNLARRYLN